MEEVTTVVNEATAKAGASEVAMIGFAVIGLGTVVYGIGSGCKKIVNKIKAKKAEVPQEEKTSVSEESKN